MNAIDKTPVPAGDISLGLLLEALSGAQDLLLIFHYALPPVKGGYHVTEVKAGQFSALNCATNPELVRNLCPTMAMGHHPGCPRPHFRMSLSHHAQGLGACRAGLLRETHL